jgi:hypothetical protein
MRERAAQTNELHSRGCLQQHDENPKEKLAGYTNERCGKNDCHFCRSIMPVVTENAATLSAVSIEDMKD